MNDLTNNLDFSLNKNIDDHSTGLIRALKQHEWISSATAKSVIDRVATQKIAPIEALLLENIPNIDAAAVARFCAEAFSHSFLDLSALKKTHLLIDDVDVKAIVALKMVPLKKRGTQMYIAMSDPTNLAVINQLQFITQCVIEPVIVEHNKLLAWLNKTSDLDKVNTDNELFELQDETAQSNEEDNLLLFDTSDVDDAPVVKFLQSVLLDAYNRGASDLHFEPYEKTYRVRYRIDGVLSEITTPPANMKERIAARLKIISKIDISEKRVPQDGRMKMKMNNGKMIDFRVSSLPTLFGEKIVMRILDSSQVQIGIDALGYDPEQKAKLLNAVGRPYGMILVTGPTGSGKTVSLYSCLNILNRPGVNISTAEDPAEINLPGINQVNINDKAGLTFPVTLRAFLRQDPDVIMVGEIRDLETADIAIKAAQTGHLVFSTLHTNDAPATLTRLLNMGVLAFNIASSIILITGQRLARRLCSCKKAASFSPEILKSAGFKDSDLDNSWIPYVPAGCEVCGGTGYKGRVGIYQVMPITEAMQSIILANGSSLDIERQARLEGVLSLRDSGLIKVKQGVTSIEEVLSVTNL
jgi:type IV pilus assembly protein PilB